MSKKVLSLICALALVLGMVVPSASHVHAVTDTTCDCGATNVEWIPFTESTTLEPNKHYRLEGDLNLSASINLNSAEHAGTYCLDLAGHTLRRQNNRTIILGKSSNGPEVVFNVMDSSSEKSGRVEGFWNNASYSAGVVYVYNGTTMNIYGGTFTTTDNDKVVAKNGGVFQVTGEVNMYGGSIVGGTVAGNGGAVCVSGAFNMSGGTITGGTAATGNCVYVGSGADMKLSGDASVEEIYFAGSSAADLTISGTYTGTTALRLSGSLVDGSAIAVSDGADIRNATLTVVGSDLTPTVSGSSIVLAAASWCEACQQNVVWQSLTGALPADASGHYRLALDVNVSYVTIKSNAKICLDLAGHTYTGSSRAFLLGDSAGNYAVDLHIMDSSANKSGVLQGKGSGTAGLVYVYRNAALSLHSGTLQLTEDGSANKGGIIATWSHATSIVNIYGGKIIGGTVTTTETDATTGCGGAIYLRGKSVLNMTGGSVISGDAENAGDCIYVENNGVVKLSGNASVEEIYFAGSSADKLTINGTYTGTAEMAFATTPAAGDDIGNCTTDQIMRENISIADTDLSVKDSGSDLVVAALPGVSVIDDTGKFAYYDTLAAGVENYNAAYVIKLLKNNSETVTVSGDCTVDLHGFDLTGNVTVGGTLYVKDSATDDFTVNDDAGYGEVAAAIVATGKVQAADGYLPLGNSFHKYILQLTKINLRPNSTGLYYTGDIKVDEAVQDQIDRFGIAVSTNSETPTADPDDAKSRYTAYGKESYDDGKATSVLIRDIMDGQGADAVDAATMIYGCPYIRFLDGTYFYGEIVSANLQQLTEVIDEKSWDNLNLTQNRALMAMYDQYSEAMSGWKLTNMPTSAQKAADAAADRVLKVLVIGNSHGLDSTNLLYEVFKEEGLPAEYDDLILGAIYTGGCSVSTHAKNALGDLPYDYWVKNDGSTADGSWIKTEDPTTREVLEDENWDVVLLQEMNTSSAREEYFTNDNIETVFTFVTKTLGYEPEFMWNMIWANPEIPESYVNYLYADGDDGSGGEVGSGSEGDDNDTSDAATIARQRAWIFQTQQPGALELWGKNYVKLWENNRQVMYNNIVSNVHNYVVGNPVHNIGMDDVMPNATAIQYAIEWMGMHEQDMYRDYTHVSDLGRLTVAYLWYAKLTGKTSIEAPKYTLVSQTLENSRQPLGYAKDYSQYSDVIKNSVNFALADHYGVIQNYTYAEYLVLTAEEQTAYEASFESFSVNSGWTFDMWLEQAVAGVTYTDYARMTDEQKTAYADLRDDFDTWYAGVVENMTYAEYFLLTDDEKTAYATLREEAFDAWLAAASAAFSYTDYVMLTYDQQNAYKATFAEGEFDTLYAFWTENMTYEEFMDMTMHQKLQYRKTYSSIADFLVWYEAAKAACEA